DHATVAEPVRALNDSLLPLELFEAAEQRFVARWCRAKPGGFLARVSRQVPTAVVDAEEDGLAVRVRGATFAPQARSREVRVDDAVAALADIVAGGRDLLLPVAHQLVLFGGLDDVRQSDGRRAAEK